MGIHVAFFEGKKHERLDKGCDSFMKEKKIRSR